jgi:hypothetical protein
MRNFRNKRISDLVLILILLSASIPIATQQSSFTKAVVPANLIQYEWLGMQANQYSINNCIF